MNINEKREFNNGINADDSITKLEPGQYLNGFNFRGDTSEAGHVLGLQSIPGTRLLVNALPAGNNVHLGGCEDEGGGRVIWANWNSNGNHGIYAYNIFADTITAVLLNSQVTGGLGFDRFHYIHSCFVENGNFYWVDDLSEPRRINISAGINMNTGVAVPALAVAPYVYKAPLTQSVINWIRRQPGMPPAATKQTDANYKVNSVDKLAFLFSYRYVYRDFELSTLSGESLLANYNFVGDLFNFIQIVLPLQEAIDQDVLRVELVANYLDSGVNFIINTWDRSLAADAAAVNNHNAGTAALTYNFYNDIKGIALDSAYSVKPYDSVPWRGSATERAKNRAFIGGYSIGFTTPQLTSLTAKPVTTTQGGGAQITGEWFELDFNSQSQNGNGHDGASSYDILKLTGIIPAPGYYITPVPTQFSPIPGGLTGPPFPATVDFATMFFLGTTIQQVMDTLAGDGSINTTIAVTDLLQSSTITGTGGGNPNFVNQIAFKSDSVVPLSIHFIDNAGRKCGYYTNPSLNVVIPDRTYGQVSFITSIQWALSNANAANEIPANAAYYSINKAKCTRTRFFVQARGANITYASKDASNVYKFDNAAYSSDFAGVAVNVSSLFPFGIGYTLNIGDIMKIYLPSGEFTLAVIDAQAEWVIIQLADLGVLGNLASPILAFIFEVYTPYQVQSNEPQFEVSQIFKITNPGLPTRTYSILTGNIRGDIVLLSRTDKAGNYLAEAMNPNDKFYKIWNTDSGRPNFIDRIGATSKRRSIAYSNTFIDGSQSNGLSTFDALDTQDLSSDFGDLQKLILTSKIQKEGSVMLAICMRETVSLYLGETQVAAPQGDAFLSVSSGVIGTIYPLKGSFGTINPESAKQYQGEVFYADANNQAIIQYSENGLEQISRFKMRTFWRKFFNKYTSLTAAQIVALGSQPYLIGGIDPFNGEYLITIPQVEAQNPNGSLPGYANNPPANLFDPYDGMAKTMTYKIEKNQWKLPYSYSAEGLINSANKVFGFKNGAAYQHNDTSQPMNSFYGTTYPSMIMFVGNILPSNPKIVNALSIESNIQPDVCYIMTDYPNIQLTDVAPNEWNNLEGVFYITVKRDRLSPAFIDPDLALSYGDKILTKAPMIQVNFVASQLVNLKYANIGFQLSSGHKSISPQQ